MTRKRLKKMLMSCGFQRNDAEQICWDIQRTGVPYAKWWREEGGFYRSCYYMKKAGNTLRKGLAQTAELIIQAINNFAKAASETLKEIGIKAE